MRKAASAAVKRSPLLSPSFRALSKSPALNASRAALGPSGWVSASARSDWIWAASRLDQLRAAATEAGGAGSGAPAGFRFLASSQIFLAPGRSPY